MGLVSAMSSTGPTPGSPGPTLRIPDREGGTRSVVVDRTWVMGVVNASPESFSDNAHAGDLARQQEQCSAMVAAGADVVDIGGQSARTNQPEIEAAAEVDRVLPLVEWMASTHPEVLVSVDTYKPQVVEAVLQAGAHVINDVSGLRYPEVAGLCADAGAALVLMHTRAAPKVRLQRSDLYGVTPTAVVDDVVQFLEQAITRALELGLPLESLVTDPGPDFTKTPHQTVHLLRHLDRVHALGRPVLLALSRKDFLGAITGRSPAGRDAATHAALAYYGTSPGQIVRVHDVAAARDVLRTVRVLAGLDEVDESYLLPENLRHERRNSP